MSKHTPGPWYTKPTHGEPNTTSIVLNDGRGGWVARLQHNGTATEDRQMSDAHLIAAAPDMLAALERLCNMPDAVVTSEYDAAWTEAERALRKARGEDHG